MLYCPPNVTLHDGWIHHGISPCFLDTLTSSIYGSIIIIFGMIQWGMYRKYATPIDQRAIHCSCLFVLQAVLTIFMPILAIARFTIETTRFDHHEIYGFKIVYLVLNLICWPLSLRLIFLERRHQLPSVPSSGHGILLLVFWTAAFVTENLAFLNFKSKDWWFKLNTFEDKVEFSLFLSRYIITFLLFSLGLKAPGIPPPQNYANLEQINDADVESGTNRNNGSGSTWRNVWRKFVTLVPFLWPKKSCLLKLNVLAVITLLVAGRVVNYFVPIYSKLIVNALGGDGSTPRFCYDLVLVFVAFKVLQGGGTGGMGLLNNLRSVLWISIQQYTSREVQVELFSHLHGLSLRWHLGRKTGEVLRVMDRGTNSINSLLNYIFFNIVPTFVDIIVAVVFFTSSFNVWFGVIVFITMALYLLVTILVTEWRTKYRRSMNLADNEQRTKGVDSLLNFETVKYYGAEEYEVSRYRTAILDYQVEEYKSNLSLCLLNTIQTFTINGGFLAGTLYCAYLVAEGLLTVGDYVLFTSYIIQLYTPLNWFGTYYRMIQQSFIDMENMFDLLEEKKEVTDKENAQMLVLPKGKIEFNNVHFSYVPEKSVLNGLTFSINPGETLAIVGPSGEGKSTIMKLIFRFFDVTQGSINIDGVDIKNFTQKSLRQAIGVVPQDTVLFNDTIKYNIRYGKISADDEQVIRAAQYADIHDKIITFPDQYDTKVGERGLKLSGGEKQRVAIARTLLKAPTFILLDEATSALDTQTERHIQNALNKVCEGRTTLIVAHRLSTVIHADKILVLSGGTIAEEGRHQELLSLNGVYTEMWRQQLENNVGSETPESTEESVTDLEATPAKGNNGHTVKV